MSIQGFDYLVTKYILFSCTIGNSLLVVSIVHPSGRCTWFWCECGKDKRRMCAKGMQINVNDLANVGHERMSRFVGLTTLAYFLGKCVSFVHKLTEPHICFFLRTSTLHMDKHTLTWDASRAVKTAQLLFSALLECRND